MKLRRFTEVGIAKTRAFLAAVKESNDVDTVTLDGVTNRSDHFVTK